MDSVQDHTCPICLEIMTEAMIITTCSHIVCRQCGEQLKQVGLNSGRESTQSCPVCRKPFIQSQLKYKDYTKILKETIIK